LEQSALTNRKELQDMRAAKQAIPTPFGNFQVPPKLALMALAFAAVLTYLSFNASVMKLRALTRAYLALQEGNQTTPLDRSPPFWLYGRGSSDFPSLFSRQTGSMASLIASAALHAGWVIFAGWLVYESWTWKSSGTLLFRYKHLSDYLLVVLLAVAAVMALVQLVPRFSKESLSSLNPATVALRKGLNRRAFLAIAITGLIAGAAYYFGLRRTSERSNNCALKFDSTSLKGYEQDLVTNLRTRVLHHRVACQNHLPRPQNSLRYEASLSSVCLHASSTARILEQLAIGDALHHRHESAVAYLRQAIDMSPLSYHLYDRLIGLYGRLRQYDEIEKLLQQGLLRVQTMKEQTRALKKPASLQAQKRMQRAEEEFNLRYGTYNDRKQLSSKR
jgi:tetratricopeptide (TPR) repeat protein